MIATVRPLVWDSWGSWGMLCLGLFVCTDCDEVHAIAQIYHD